jgi:pimeloyl-ACP methyl ester carboxylesterase
MMRAMPTEILLPGLHTVEHEFTVPLDHSDPRGAQITVFAREVREPEGADRPWLVFFQGGPGFEASRPYSRPRGSGWMERALKEFRLLLLDQRGTGRSTPVGTLPGLSPAEQADYLAHFRADSIVSDAEWIRRELGVERWSVLGQSFGGFCVMTYLSLAPEGLREALLTGGIPPLERSADEIYRHTYDRVLERNRSYLERFPGDRGRLERLREKLDNGEVNLPTGEPLTWRRFRQAGLMLGMSDGAERLHYLLELDPGSPGFRYDAMTLGEFPRNPIYAVLHEACYCDGGRSGWAAERVLPPEFEDSMLLTGEHVYRWMFEDYAELRGLAGAADLLAEREWPRLYDPDALAANPVPAAAAVYAEDMYVERKFSEETVERVRGLRMWLTNEYDHNGLRVDGDRIISHLLNLARGRL